MSIRPAVNYADRLAMHDCLILHIRCPDTTVYNDVTSSGFGEIGPIPACFFEQGGSHRRGGAFAPANKRRFFYGKARTIACKRESKTSEGAFFA